MTIADPTHFDERGLPWRGSVRKGSLHYFPKQGITILLDGIRFVGAGIIEFNRLEGWLLVKPWKGDRIERYVYGRVELLWTPTPGAIVTDLTGIRLAH